MADAGREIPRCPGCDPLPGVQVGMFDHTCSASREATSVKRLRDYLDSLDEQTRRPGEPPLREAVAQQARARLGEIRTTVPKPEHSPVGPSGVSPSPDGSR